MNEFIQARGFNSLSDKGTRLPLPDRMYAVLFENESDALAFGRYVGGFPKRLMPDCSTRARSFYSEKHDAYIAELSIRTHGFQEEGVVLCQDSEVVAIAVRHKGGLRIFPLKTVSLAVKTKSGTLYVRFADGSAYCRSQSDGPQALASALYFASSLTDAGRVQENGGELGVADQPASGLYPVYVTGERPVSAGRGLVFERGSFRLGTAVQRIVAG